MKEDTQIHKYAPHPRISPYGGWDQMDASIAFLGMIKFRVQ